MFIENELHYVILQPKTYLKTYTNFIYQGKNRFLYILFSNE